MSKHSAADAPGDTAQITPGAPASKREILVVMGGLLLCVLLAMLDNTIVGPALPTIVGDLGGLEHLSWVFTAYTLATAVSTLIWGKLGDLFGRKQALLASVVVFLAGSALTGLAQNMNELIGFRAVQGIGAGGLIVGVMSIIGQLIPPRDRGRYTGLIAAVMPIALVGGPLVGGWLTDNASWRWAFYVNIPLGLIVLAVVSLTLHLPKVQRGPVRIDWTGIVLLTVWASAAVLLASWGGNTYAWISWQIIGLAIIAVAGLAVFIRVERRVADPILPLGVFANRNFSLAGVLAFVTGVAMMGSVSLLPQYQQLVQGASATNSGLLLLPMMAAMMVTSVTVGLLMSKYGKSRIFPIIGGAVLIVGMLLFTRVAVDTSVFVLALYMVVFGLGVGFLMQPSQLIAQNALGMKDMGSGMGANKFLQTMGMSVGTAILGSVYTAHLSSSLTASLGSAGSKVASGGTSITPSAMGSLPEPVQQALKMAVSGGISSVFFVGTIFAALALLVALFIKEVPLRTSNDTDGAADVLPDGPTALAETAAADPTNAGPTQADPSRSVATATGDGSIGQHATDERGRHAVSVGVQADSYDTQAPDSRDMVDAGGSHRR